MFKKISEIFSRKKLDIITQQRLSISAQRVIGKIDGENVNINTFLIPKRFRDCFEIECIKEKPKEFNLILREKRDQIPKEASGKNLILKGFLNPVEVINFPTWEKPMYIIYHRRRWREKETDQDYFNEYEFHPEGVKATHEFASFLKEADRRQLDALRFDWKDIRYIRKEDFCLV